MVRFLLNLNWFIGGGPVIGLCWWLAIGMQVVSLQRYPAGVTA